MSDLVQRPVGQPAEDKPCPVVRGGGSDSFRSTDRYSSRVAGGMASPSPSRMGAMSAGSSMLPSSHASATMT
ncbi:MAG: hypothetical protein ACRDRH_29415, partial [Pseudonocardia sp.]